MLKRVTNFKATRGTADTDVGREMKLKNRDGG
jgi:hypothetical protein